MRTNGAIVMEFAFFFQCFLVTSSNSFGLLETMVITLKFKVFFCQQHLSQLMEDGVAEEWTAPRKSPLPHCGRLGDRGSAVLRLLGHTCWCWNLSCFTPRGLVLVNSVERSVPFLLTDHYAIALKVKLNIAASTYIFCRILASDNYFMVCKCEI